MKILTPHNYPIWDKKRWPNFSASEFACRHCGEYIHDPVFLDTMQALRHEAGPLHILSGHRCAIHNAKVGGAPLSQHLSIAADISLKNHLDRKRLAQVARDVGFTGFGYYQTFLHVDLGRARHWDSGDIARKLWQ